jgi:hypothetical protein
MYFALIPIDAYNKDQIKLNVIDYSIKIENLSGCIFGHNRTEIIIRQAASYSQARRVPRRQRPGVRFRVTRLRVIIRSYSINRDRNDG